MPGRVPLTLRHGPLTVYLQSLDGCPDLQPLVASRDSQAPLIWLDSARHHPVTGRWSLVGFDPWLTLSVRHDRVTVQTSDATHITRNHPLEVLRSVLHRYRAPQASPVPAGDFAGGPGQAHARALGLMGCLSYELNRWIEPTLQRRPTPPGPPVPDMIWYAMRLVVLSDHLRQRTWLLSIVDPHSPAPYARRQACASLEELAADVRASMPDATPPFHASSLTPTTTQAEFEAMVARAREHIAAGDIFQANLSQRFSASWVGDPFTLYRALRRINPSPFACYLSGPELSVVSCSPERLIRVQGRRADTRPIAGTRPRGASPTEDAVLGLELLMNEKERAEHIMLVDLARNDVGRIAEMGSVSVDELMTLEEYSHVIHIVSDVAGTLRRGVDAVDVIQAVFPGGTITGCPKVRCMELLQELEPVARGIYTGSLGYLGFDGTVDLNIAIRTIVLQRDPAEGGTSRLSFHVGAGIVADSEPTREYQETLAKAGALMSALEETHAFAR